MEMKAMVRLLKLSLGPILTYWPRLTVFEFYQMIAETPVDIVYLGETVCSRRHELRLDDWLDVAELLVDSGKEVVLSTLALIESNSDLTALRRIAANGRFRVEANDMGAVNCLAGQAPFVAGMWLNLYNAPSLDLMAQAGAERWVTPIEMGRQQLVGLLNQCRYRVETEVFAYGRMPLALSARCMTARNRNLPKDDCQFSCLEHPDGLLLRSREGQPFLVLNGTQTQSANVHNLISELDDMRAIGIDVVRLSPQAEGTSEVIAIFDQVRRGALSTEQGAAQLAPLLPGDACNGYWHGKPGMAMTSADFDPLTTPATFT
jgi:collagenase-like PrtC family protease